MLAARLPAGWKQRAKRLASGTKGARTLFSTLPDLMGSKCGCRSRPRWPWCPVQSPTLKLGSIAIPRILGS